MSHYESYYDLQHLLEALNAQRARQAAAAPAPLAEPELPRRPNPAASTAPRGPQRPRMDLYEDDEENLVTAHFEFPGVAKEDIHIDVQNGRLTVAAEIKLPTPRHVSGAQQKQRVLAPEQDENYLVQERRFGKLSRTIQLPAGVNEDDVRAYMENGLLTITFPQRPAQRPPTPQRIFIQWY